MNEITIVTVNNPFKSSDRSIQKVDYTGGSMYKYVSGKADGKNTIASLNGHVISKRLWKKTHVPAGSSIAICPVVGKGGGNKQILSLIAGIALSVVAMGVGSLVSGGAFFGHGALAMSAWSWGGYLAALAIMAVGGVLISRTTPQPKLDLPEQSNSYSWNSSYMLTGQGNALSIIYGTVKPTPLLLSRHVTSDGEKQYLTLILCLGDGPVDSVTNIKINDNPIANYSDVQYEIRFGTNDQESFDHSKISSSTDTFADQPLSYELETAAEWTDPGVATHQTDGNAAQGLEIEMSFPSGLYAVNDEGGLITASVKIEAQYKASSASEWVNIFGSDVKISSMTTNFAGGSGVYNGTGAIYNIKVGPKARPETWSIGCIEQQMQNGFGGGITYGKKFAVSGSVTGAAGEAVFGQHYSNDYISFDISQNFQCLIGFQFTVTLSGVMEQTISAASSSAIRRTYRVDNLSPAQYDIRVRCTAKSGTSTRYSTRVFWTMLSSIIYDDFHRPGKVLLGIKALATGQLFDSTPKITCLVTRAKVWVYNSTAMQYQQKNADNPAWASYDLIHRAKFMKDVRTNEYDFVISGAPKEKMVWQDFSDWADFCDEYNLKVNYIVEKSADLMSALREIEGCGRGKVIIRGTRFGAVCDKPSEAVQVFTVANIIKNTFKEEFLPLKDRADALEISFNNSAKNYDRDVITVYGEDYYTTKRVKNPTQIAMDGIIFLAQAICEGRYRLRLNKYLIRTASFEAGVDAIACEVGDVIKVQHDIPQWGYGGRIMNVSYDDTLRLDQKITLEANAEYSIIIRLLSDIIIEKTIAAAEHERITDTIEVSIPFAIDKWPQQYDVYTLGKINLASKPFRVIRISRASDQTRKINVLEYKADINNESSPIPEINYSALKPYVDVTNLAVGQETYAQKDGTIMSVLYVSWDVPRNRRIMKYHAFYSPDMGVTWFKWGETDLTKITIYGVQTLRTYVVKICTMNEIGILSPGVISQFIAITGKDLPPDNVASLTVTPDLNDKTRLLLEWPAVGNVDLRGYELSESNSLISKNITETRYAFRATQTRKYVFQVRSIDTSGNYSALAAVAEITVSVEPSNVTGFTATVDPYDRTKVIMKWNGISEIDISNFEIREGDSWADGQVIAQLKTSSYTYQLTTSGFHRFWIKAVNLGGFYSVNEAGASGQFNFFSQTPTAGQVVQDINDRTRLIASWLPVADPDVIQYEIRMGLDWDTGTIVGIVKGTTITYVISASGTYNFMVRSKNVAGYYSSILHISGTFSVEVSNVTNFTGTRAANDKSKLRLGWSPVPERDVDHYEIREGLTWESGTLVFGNVAGTFYDATTAAERTYKYWIKAVSKAGKYSLSPTLFSILISMNPTAPGNLTVTTDPADRTKALIAWTASPDLDVIEYEVRRGIDWASGTAIVKTKELHYTWTAPESEKFAIRLRARNASGFESDEVVVSYDSYIEPSDIAGFKALQNGENVLLIWNKIPDVDVVGFEVREGLNWETAALLATGITGTAFQFLADRETTRTFLIKAINRAGKASQSAALADVTITNLPPRNVVVTYDEIALRDGAKNGTTFGPSQFKYSTFGGKFNDYTTTKFSEVGGANVLILDAVPATFQNIPGSFDQYPDTSFQDKVPLTFQNLPGAFSDYPSTTFDARGPFVMLGDYTTTIKDIGKIMTANISAVFTSSTLRTVGTTASLLYRTSADNITWTDWKPYLATQTILRYIQFKAVLTTNNPTKTPEVNQFSINVDVPDVIRNGSFNVAADGSTIDFGYSFYVAPAVVPTATILGHRATLNGTPGLSNFNVKVYDENNNAVGGPILWIARGY